MGKRLAIIGAGRVACSFAENAREMGVTTYCFAWEQGAIAKDAVDCYYPISIFEQERILEICRQSRIDGVVATTELTIPVAAYIAESLDLNGMPLDVAREITDKARNRAKVAHIQALAQPGYLLLPLGEEIKEPSFGYPVVVKPLAKGGKRGVSVASCRDEFLSAIAYAKEDGGADGSVLVEEFIEGGTECSVESLSYHGRHFLVQITEKVTSGPPHCVELAHHQPALLSDDVRERLGLVIADILDSLGIMNGPCHTEIIVKDGRIYLVEANARPGGDMISDPLVELSTGYPYIKGAIEIAFDDFCAIEAEDMLQHYSGICFVTEQTKHLRPLYEECEKHDWLYRKHAGGDVAEIVHNDADAVDYFIYRSSSGRPV